MPSTQDCGAYTCSEDNGECRTDCNSDADCAAGAVCRSDGKCAFQDAQCSGPFDVELADGTIRSCNGHQCNAGNCEETCAEDLDCAPDYECVDADCARVMPESSSSDAGQPSSGGADAGSGARAMEGTDAGTGSSADNPAAGDPGGCGCTTPGHRHPTRNGTALLGLLGLSVLARRRTRGVVANSAPSSLAPH